ncbi:MAG: winged helix-turn-helix transcriptional regulator [Nanoarchaeota archaeon]
MVERLNDLDKKLIAQLYHDARKPLTEIAKNLHLSREQVSYRINKFEKEGIIRGYVPLVNYSKFGYSKLTIIFLKFRNLKFMNELKKKVVNDGNRISYGELLAKYDLFIVAVFKNEADRNEYILRMLEENEGISDYSIIEPYYLENYPLKFFGYNEKSHLIKDYSGKPIKLDEKEKLILSILSKNATAKVIDIAIKAKMSAELVVYKIKRLKKEGLWIGARAYIDSEKMNYSYTILLLNGQLPASTRELLKKFAEKSPNIESLAFMINNPSCYIQLFHKENSELTNTLKKLREILNENIEITIIPLKNEGEDLNPLPFL